MILDEPTTAMDMESTLLSENLMEMYVKATRCALILVTHSLQQARRIADEVLYHPAQPEAKTFLDFYGA